MNEPARTDQIVVGKIGAPYGVRGWVKLHSFTEPAENLFSYPLLLSTKGGWQTIKIEQFKAHADTFVAKVVGIEDRDQAALLTNAEVAVQRADLPSPESGEYYWADLIGLNVYNQDNVCLGQVVDFFATGANDVIVIRGEHGEHLLPYVLDEFIVSIDLDKQRMDVHWELE